MKANLRTGDRNSTGNSLGKKKYTEVSYRTYVRNILTSATTQSKNTGTTRVLPIL